MGQILERAVEKGYSNLDVFKLHPDLTHIRDTERFEKLMKVLEKNAAIENHNG
jgi:hypothetical protein